MNREYHGDTCLALDLGGTKLLIGEVDREGQILRSKQYASGSMTQQEAVQVLCAALDDYTVTVDWVGEKPGAMGIGMIGQVDYKAGVWVMIDPSRKDPTPIKEILEKRYGLTCRIENDVKSATLAEKNFGAGRDTNQFIYVNIGTGIAAGFMADGHLLRGWANDSGEIGHMVVDRRSDVACVCGKRGCVEAIASGHGMYARCLHMMDTYPHSPLYRLGDAVTVNDIFGHGRTGDPLAKLIVDDAVDAVAHLLMNLVRAVNPEKIILGGGVMADGWMLEQVKGRMGRQELESVTKGIALTALNPRSAGILGAAAVGFGLE